MKEGDEDRMAELQMSMCGTRDAAKIWQECYTTHLEEIGFVPGKANVYSSTSAATSKPWFMGMTMYPQLGMRI